MIASRWGRCWEEKPELKLQCRDVFLPCDAKNHPQTGHVEEVKCFHKLLISNPCFSAIKKVGKNDISIYCDCVVASDMPHRFHKFLLSQPKVALAFASLTFSASSMTIDYIYIYI